MEISIQQAVTNNRREKPPTDATLGFGKYYSDHMFTMAWNPENKWHDLKITPFAPFNLSPATMVLHYGQTIFEGLKAYRTETGRINLFRPEKNWERLNQSAARLVMPEIDQEVFLTAIQRLVALDRDWVPDSYGASLYIRPTLIGTEPFIGLKPSSTFLFFIITGPVGAYYPGGFNPVSIQVCERYSRAGPGGLGEAKTAANYAASLLAQKEASGQGFNQVLWLDACERKYLEEVGSMNIFLKIKGTLITPPLGGSILGGVTRDSVIRLAKSWNIPVEENRISIEEVLEAQRNGTLEEIFGAGTAAVISPVGLLNYKGESHPIGDGKTGTLAHQLFDEIMGIQYSLKPDPFQWVSPIHLE
ncbi:MAG: branched-chain amino acid aminotransferase [Deltaproteobacteria bacterium]|nr:branched-chain amino acid aminotransferase [Deltaproteobacteria bacterium]